jgi:ketosteroid isomerase-like protein
VRPDRLDLIERAVAALNTRDLDAYLACCTEDMELHTPLAELGGVYEGAAGIARFLSDIADTTPDFRLKVEDIRLLDDDRALAFLRVHSSGRASGLPAAADTETANLYDFAGGRIRRVRIFMDRAEALREAGVRDAP